jgi:hypothetical protein
MHQQAQHQESGADSGHCPLTQRTYLVRITPPFINGYVTNQDTQALLSEFAQTSTFMSFRLPVLWQRNLKTFASADQTDASVIIREALKEWAERRNRNIAGFL